MWLFIKQLTFRTDHCINIKPVCFMFRRAVFSSFGKWENIPKLSANIARSFQPHTLLAGTDCTRDGILRQQWSTNTQWHNKTAPENRPEWARKTKFFCVFLTWQLFTAKYFHWLSANPNKHTTPVFVQKLLPVSANTWSPSNIVYPVLSWDQKTENNSWHATIFLTLSQCFLVSRETHKTHVKKSLL